MGHKKVVGQNIDWCYMADKEQEEQDNTARKRQKHSGGVLSLLPDHEVSRASGGDRRFTDLVEKHTLGVVHVQ